MIILKVTKKQVFTLSLEDAFFGKTTEGHITHPPLSPPPPPLPVVFLGLIDFK